MTKTIYCARCENIHRTTQACKPWDAGNGETTEADK